MCSTRTARLRFSDASIIGRARRRAQRRRHSARDDIQSLLLRTSFSMYSCYR